MLNIKTLKLNKILDLNVCLRKKTQINKEYEEYLNSRIEKEVRLKTNIKDSRKLHVSLECFEPLSGEHKEKLRRDIADCKEAIKKLSITEEMRKKKTAYLTKEEKNKLYDEYILNSMIKASQSGIEYGTCDLEYLLQEVEAEYGVTRY